MRAERSGAPPPDTDRNQSGMLPPKPIHAFTRFFLDKESSTFGYNGAPLDLAGDGYPFYAGEFELETTLELPADIDRDAPAQRLLLAFPCFEAVVLRVVINGAPCAPLFASPWETDVTDMLKPGANTVRVALTNSLRNLLGPHHHKGGEHVAVGPATFRANNQWPHNLRDPGEADWYDARREDRATAWRDDYHLIPFGFIQPPVLLRASVISPAASA